MYSYNSRICCVKFNDSFMWHIKFNYRKSRNLCCIKVMQFSVTLIIMSSKSCEFQPWDTCTEYFNSYIQSLNQNHKWSLIFSVLDIASVVSVYCCNTADSYYLLASILCFSLPDSSLLMCRQNFHFKNTLANS